jgi:aminoglycoside phosphotransferase (APT) family kinase protein
VTGGLPDASREADGWVADLVQVCRSLGRIPRARGLRLGVRWSSPTDVGARWKDLFPRVRRWIHPLLTPTDRVNDLTCWRRYLADTELSRVPPRFNHGDLFPHHILVRRDRVVGILDWGDACFEDPVGNVAGLPTVDGFADRVCNALAKELGPRNEDRLAFHRHTSRAYSAIEGVVGQNSKLLRSGLRRYRTTIPRPPRVLTG